MKELETAVVAVFNTMAQSGALEKVIEDRISKTVAECVSNVLGPYSDFGKNLKEHVEKALKIDMRDLGLVGYNETVLKIVRTQLDHNINTIGRARMEQGLAELLADPPAEIKLSVLVEKLKEHNSDSDYRECTCIVEYSDTSYCSDYKRIYLDKDHKREKRECSVQLAVTGNGEVYSFHVSGQDLKNTMFAGPFYGFDRVLFQMYAAKTKVIIDEDDVSTYYPGHED